jgi:NAD(P)-dependent dehydrogenase (short-subunit alcohol dehydrogenase family)
MSKSMENQMKELEGKFCVVTGATAGMGLYTLKELAKKGSHVIGIGRSEQRCEAAKNEVLAEIPGAQVDYLIGDLSAQAHIRKLAMDIRALLHAQGDDSLYCLINNAGTCAGHYIATDDGIELQLAVNFLAPFLLTHLLMPALKKKPDARILTVSSESHYKTIVNWNNVQLKHCYISLWAYKQSKLFTVLFMRALDQRIRPLGLRAFAVDPGLVNTDIGYKDTGWIEHIVWSLRKKMAVTIPEGSATAVHLACAPENGCKEIYWRDCKERKAAANSYSEKNMRRVWALGEKLCNIKSDDYGI